LALKLHGKKDCIKADGWLCKNWFKYKASIGHGKLWHFTLTTFWVKIVADIIEKTTYDTFEAFWTANSVVQDASLHKKYYSDERLMKNPKARKEWVEPDLMPLQPKQKK